MTEERPDEETFGRLADPDATDEVTLPGGCRCPGAPHEADTATYRTQLGAGERNSIRAAGWQATGMEYYDWEAGNDAAIAKAVVSWTLLSAEPCTHVIQVGSKKELLHGPNEPVPINRRTAALLDEPTRIALLTAIDGAADSYTARLPNGSGAPSAKSPRASASPNRATRRHGSSTKS